MAARHVHWHGYPRIGLDFSYYRNGSPLGPGLFSGHHYVRGPAADRGGDEGPTGLGSVYQVTTHGGQGVRGQLSERDDAVLVGALEVLSQRLFPDKAGAPVPARVERLGIPILHLSRSSGLG